MDSFLKSPVVIDNGSGYIKVGFSGEQKRPQIFPSIIGRPKYDVVIPNTNNQYQHYMGQQLNGDKRGLYKLKYPMTHGVVDQWDDMELLWKHAFGLLKVSPSQCPVLLTQANMNPTKNRRKMFQIFFQKFQVPALFVAVQGVLSLFATGKSTGIVLDSGDGVTHVVPVYQGYALNNACERINLGGRDVTQHLKNLLRKSGVNFNTSAQFQLIKAIKEKYCSISSSPVQKSRQKKQKYTLPDGQSVQFTNGQKQAGQILFCPQRIGLQFPSVVQLLSNSLSRVDIDLRTTLYSQIVLSGGNTMFDGFPQRFIKDLKRTLPNDVKSRVLAPSKRDTMCWEGGSILASLPSFSNMWITRKEYDQQKEQVIQRKAF